ncbi:Aste57867_13013 [Aphanomyces stellatus]|uniref:Aste57867_13013 protein n=1 Tax=Aphanomyces stellatus TaxID=120398 RepID=A0A485KX35_9STRA|nr:hypothetical protein As57867_012965 [Aphanomyces stellatus]VFT89858.1 Aste57867_13013 [Aphanomyces stellatus]
MQFAAALNRSGGGGGRGGGYAHVGSGITSFGSITALPIKGKKLTKSQRKAAAAAAKQASMPRQVIQWVEECLGDHVWELVFDYLDVSSLCQSKLVCRHFCRLGQLPLPWMHIYAAKWCLSHPPLVDAYRQCTWIQLWCMHIHRTTIDVPLSTRAAVSKDPASSLVAIVNNSMLRSLVHTAVESIRSLQPLPSIPCAAALGRHVVYFEVAAAAYISAGFVELPQGGKCAYGFGSDLHVGWHTRSFGYHSHGGIGASAVLYHTGDERLTAAVGGNEDNHGRFEIEDDVIGCGYDHDHSRMFFTRNGTFLGPVPAKIPQVAFAAAISINDLDAVVRINWGQAPFAYAIETHVAHLAPAIYDG